MRRAARPLPRWLLKDHVFSTTFWARGRCRHSRSSKFRIVAPRRRWIQSGKHPQDDQREKSAARRRKDNSQEKVGSETRGKG